MARLMAGLKWGVGAAVLVTALVFATSLVSSKTDPSAAAAGPFIVMLVAPIALIVGAAFGAWRGR